MTNLKLRDDLGETEYAIELECLIEVAGEYFCVADSCEGCKHKSYCTFEEKKTYIDLVPPIRTAVKTSPEAVDRHSQEHTKGAVFESGRWQGETQYLTASKKRVYKTILDLETPYKNREVPHIVFNFEENKYQCIKQNCSTCKLKDGCKSEIEIKPYSDVIAVTDLAAQEPRNFTITTGMNKANLERNWLSVFNNDSIRSLGKPYELIAELFRRVGVDTDNDDTWSRWINIKFFYDKTEMYKFAEGLNNLALSDGKQGREEVKALIEKLTSEFFSYRDTGTM